MGDKYLGQVVTVFLIRSEETRMKDISQENVRSVDLKYQTPLQDFHEILNKLKELYPEMNTRRVANFSSHFLTGFFEHGSREWKMANALMANVYYYHYVSLMNDDEGESKKNELPTNNVISGQSKE